MKRNSNQQHEEELKSIKEQYLGSKRLKKQIVKPSEKFKFSFDWNNSEDTSRDINPLYQTPHEAQLLFGRGFRGGIDHGEQKKSMSKSKNNNDSRNKFGSNEGVITERQEQIATQKPKRETTNTYDRFDIMHLDIHWSQKKVEEMTQRDWRIFQEDYQISYKGSNFPHPMRSWNEGALNLELIKVVTKFGYSKLTPIQMAAIPIGLEQRDVIGVAETGSGKTLAFVLPMLSNISKLPRITEELGAEGPYALVLAPTRELAKQIEVETIKFAQSLEVRVVSIVGGHSIEKQGFQVQQGCEIIIATPGRLLDCLEKRYVVLNQCNYLVFDEVDQMIDMGFEPQVTGILDAMPASCHLKPKKDDVTVHAHKHHRTTYMFSATMSPVVERLARKYLQNPVVITIGTANKPVDSVTQNVMMVKEAEKWNRLCRIVNEMDHDTTVIIFVNTKKSADLLSKQLGRNGYLVTTLHGGKTQDQRDESLDGFKTKKFHCLVATDVVGRGIDIPNVAHVINYDMPLTIEKYIHRIGRIGRAGRTGVATTFLTPFDSDVFPDLKRLLAQGNHHIPYELARHK